MSPFGSSNMIFVYVWYYESFKSVFETKVTLSN